MTGRVVVGLLATERGARAAWTRVAEPGDARVAELVAALGAAESLAVTLDGTGADGERYRQRTLGTDLAEVVAFGRRRGMRMVIPGDPDWPGGFDDLAAPPVGVWAWGAAELASLREAGVAVVGARACTAYGIGVASELAGGLAEHGYAVVSGAAYGIDRAAHEGCLAVGGTTVAVLAGGLDRVYPPEHAGLLSRIAEAGAVMSEVAPGGAPTKFRFIQRNRLIATMTAGTLVVEASLRSGSLRTARAAEEHSRPVGAVPGPVTSRASSGCHQAIRDGYATLVTDTSDALDLFGRLGVDASPHRSDPVLPVDRLPAQDREVFALLPVRAPVTIDRLARLTGLPPTALAASVGRLELAGVAERLGNGWKQVPEKRRSETVQASGTTVGPRGGRPPGVPAERAGRAEQGVPSVPGGPVRPDVPP